MGCNTSRSTTVVESVQKPGGQPEEEEENEDPGTETTADAIQNLVTKNSACDRAS